MNAENMKIHLSEGGGGMSASFVAKTFRLALAGWMTFTLVAYADDVAQAEKSIAVNFYLSGVNNITAESGIPFAGDGLVPAQVWNNVSLTDRTKNGSFYEYAADLLDDSGDGTTAKMAMTTRLSLDNGNYYVNVASATNLIAQGIGGSQNWPGVESLRVTEIPFAFYDVIVYQQYGSGSFQAPELNGWNLTGAGTFEALAPTYGKAGQKACAEQVNAVYARQAFTSKELVLRTRAKPTGGKKPTDGVTPLAALQIVEVSEVNVPVAEDASWSSLGLAETETRQVSVINVADGKTLSVTSDELAAVEELATNTCFITFNESGKLDLTLVGGATSVRVRTKNLKPENLTVRVTDGTETKTVPNVYLSCFDEYLQISTEALTFGDERWITELEANVKWFWTTDGGMIWQTVTSLDQLAEMSLTAFFDGGHVKFVESFATYGYNMEATETTIRFQAKALEEGVLKCLKVELSFDAEKGVVSAKGIEPRQLATSDYATDLWESGEVPEQGGQGKPGLAGSYLTDCHGIYRLRAVPHVAAVDPAGANYADVMTALSNAAATGLNAVTIVADAVIASDAKFPDDLAVMVAEGKTLTISPGATLMIGTSRVTGSLAFGEGATLALTVTDLSETIELDAEGLSADEVSIVGADGAKLDGFSVDVADGIVTIKKSFATLNASGETEFESGSWTGAYQEGGEIVVHVTGETTVNLANARSFATVYVSGEGSLRFTGAALDATTVSVAEDVTLVIDATAADGVKEVASSLAGAGKVATEGNVRFTKANSFTGGLTVRSGTLALAAPGDFGAGDVTVCDGASIDLAHGGALGNVFTIAGEGVDGNGALFVSVATANATNRIMALTLAADATVFADVDWGLVSDSSAAVRLSPGGHALVKRGAGKFIVHNAVKPPTDTTVGKIIVKEGALAIGDFELPTGIGFFVETGATLEWNNTKAVAADNGLYMKKTFAVLDAGSTLKTDIAVKNSSSPVFVFRPTENTPVAVEGSGSLAALQWMMIAHVGMIDQKNLKAGQEILLVINNLSTAWSAGNFARRDAQNGCRFANAYNPHDVRTTVQPIRNFWHYDFERGTTEELARAEDSTKNIPAWSKTANATTAARGGTAVLLDDKFNFAWSGPPKHPLMKDANFDSEVATVTTVIKPIATDGRIVWSLGRNMNDYAALVVENTNTLAVVAKDKDPAIGYYRLATVSEIANLTNAEHFVAVRFTPRGTTLIVDDKRDETTRTAPQITETTCATLGCEQDLGMKLVEDGKTIEFKAQSADGCWLNDWQMWDAELSDKELSRIRNKFWPSGLSIIIR